MVIRLKVRGLKKTFLLCHLALFWGRGKKGWCDLVCEAPLDDWANGGFDDVFFTYGEDGFSSIGI